MSALALAIKKLILVDLIRLCCNVNCLSLQLDCCKTTETTEKAVCLNISAYLIPDPCLYFEMLPCCQLLIWDWWHNSSIKNKNHPVCIYSLSRSVRYFDYLQQRCDSICALTSGFIPLPVLSPPLLLHHFILTVNTESCLFSLPSVHRQNILTSMLPS